MLQLGRCPATSICESEVLGVLQLIFCSFVGFILCLVMVRCRAAQALRQPGRVQQQPQASLPQRWAHYDPLLKLRPPVLCLHEASRLPPASIHEGSCSPCHVSWGCRLPTTCNACYALIALVPIRTVANMAGCVQATHHRTASQPQLGQGSALQPPPPPPPHARRHSLAEATPRHRKARQADAQAQSMHSYSAAQRRLPPHVQVRLPSANWLLHEDGTHSISSDDRPPFSAW